MYWLTGAALVQISVGLSWLVTRWLQFGPWQRDAKITLRTQAFEMLVNGLPHFLFAYGYIRNFYPLLVLSLIYYPLWIIWQVGTHRQFWGPRSI